MNKPVKIPGPDHPITLEPATRRWRAIFQGHVIADSNDAIILREASYPARVYFPRSDVSMDYMSRTDRSSHCPYKGDAAYYTLLMDGHFAENAVWTYEDPFPAMAQINGRLAFYPEKVEIYEVDDAAVNPHHAQDAREHTAAPTVDDVVRHTDSGAGASQRAHWAATVETPHDDGGLR